MSKSETICRWILDRWSDRYTHRKLNWLELEDQIQEILRCVDKDETTPKQALSMIDESLAAFTRRGSCIVKHKDDSEWRIL